MSTRSPRSSVRFLGGALVALFAASALVAVATTPAAAVSTVSGSRIAYDQAFFAFVEADETFEFSFTQTNAGTVPVTIRAIDPAGTVQEECEIPAAASNAVAVCSATGLSSVAGVWTLELDTDELAYPQYLYSVVVRDAAETEIPGRIWVEDFAQYQRSASTQNYWIGTREGYVYHAQFLNYNGAGSFLSANGFGLVDAGTCNPVYQSVEGSIRGANGVWIDPAYEFSDECGDRYKLFLEAPASDLPHEAPSATGTQWIRPDIVAPSAANLAFTPDDAFSWAGDITFDLAGVNGGYTIQIDTNNNGVYTDPVDRIIPWGSPPGAVTVPFDGEDGLGNLIGTCQAMNAQVVVDRAGEVHFVLDDVEQLGSGSGAASGVRLTGVVPEPGPGVPNPLLYWDDTQLVDVYPGEPYGGKDGTAGVDTSTIADNNGTHGWRSNWGNVRSIENWSYYTVSAGAEVAVTPPCQPSMTIDKVATLDDDNDNGFADADETITYSFTVTNTGNADLFGVAVVDPSVSGLSPATADIPVGDIQVFTAAPYLITQDDVDTGGVSNTALATGEDPNGDEVESPEDSTFIPGVERDPGLAITKNAELVDDNTNGVADLDEEILYTFTVENTGNVTLENVDVVDTMLSGITPVAPATSPVTLAPGQTVEFSADPYIVTQDDLNTGAVDNSAVATGDSSVGEIESPPDTTTTPTPVPDPLLELEKSWSFADPADDVNGDGLADVGDTITYSFTVSNTGTVDLDDVSVIDPKVAVITPDAIGIGANATEVFTAEYVVQQSDIDYGSVVNTAFATGFYTGGEDTVQVDSSPDTETVPTPERAPSLEVEKSGELVELPDSINGLADVGETILYSFEVTNTGNTTLAGVEVLDPRLSGLVPAGATLLPEGVETFTADPYIVTQADVDAGGVFNEASARGHIPNGPETFSPPDDSFHPGPEPEPELELEKTGILDDTNGNGTADAGEEITYQFVVTNTGNVTLFDVSIDDDRIAELLPASIDVLPPSNEYTFESAPYEVTPADVSAGEIVNTAFAFGMMLDGETVVDSPDDTAVTPATVPAETDTPDLAVTGASNVFSSIVGALTLLLAGGWLLIVRTRARRNQSGTLA